MVRKMFANALTLKEIFIPPSFVFFSHGYMQQAGPGWRGTHDLSYHMYLTPEQTVLNGVIAFASERRFCWSKAHNQKVTASRSVNSLSSGGERGYSWSDCGDENGMETDIGGEHSSNSQLGRFAVMSSLSSE